MLRGCEALDLRGNDVCDHGIEHIAKALTHKDCKGMSLLDLSENKKVTREGKGILSKCFADCSRNRPAVTKKLLSISIADAWEISPGMRSLNLCGEHLDIDDIWLISAVLSDSLEVGMDVKADVNKNGQYQRARIHGAHPDRSFTLALYDSTPDKPIVLGRRIPEIYIIADSDTILSNSLAANNRVASEESTAPLPLREGMRVKAATYRKPTEYRPALVERDNNDGSFQLRFLDEAGSQPEAAAGSSKGHTTEEFSRKTVTTQENFIVVDRGIIGAEASRGLEAISLDMAGLTPETLGILADQGLAKSASVRSLDLSNNLITEPLDSGSPLAQPDTSGKRTCGAALRNSVRRHS